MWSDEGTYLWNGASDLIIWEEGYYSYWVYWRKVNEKDWEYAFERDLRTKKKLEGCARRKYLQKDWIRRVNIKIKGIEWSIKDIYQARKR